MKKLLFFFATLCLVACNGNDPEGGSTTKGDYVDLGLESGTKWKTQNEQRATDYYNLFDYETALNEFGRNLPSKEQWEELRIYCHWEWTGSGMKVTGPNGKSIVLPVAGYRYTDGSVHLVNEEGFYWSSTPDVSESAWYLRFSNGHLGMHNDGNHIWGQSVRLVR